MEASAGVPIVVYTLSGCPHCRRALGLLARRGLQAETICGDREPDFRRRLAGLTGGSTVPQIVIGERAIGGADQLARLDRLGVLEALVAGAAFPVVRVRRRGWRPRRSSWVAETFAEDGQRTGSACGSDEQSALRALAARRDIGQTPPSAAATGGLR